MNGNGRKSGERSGRMGMRIVPGFRFQIVEKKVIGAWCVRAREKPETADEGTQRNK